MTGAFGIRRALPSPQVTISDFSRENRGVQVAARSVDSAGFDLSMIYRVYGGDPSVSMKNNSWSMRTRFLTARR
jgi:hypothetical protein